jgi:hypothetical protein
MIRTCNRFVGALCHARDERGGDVSIGYACMSSALHRKDTVEIGCPLLGPTRSLASSPTGIRGIRAGIGQSNKLPVPSLIHILEVLLPPDYLTGLCQTGVHRRISHSANLRPVSALLARCFVHQHTPGKKKEESDRTRRSILQHTRPTPRHTAHRQKSQSIHLFTASRIASPGLSRCTAPRSTPASPSLTRLVFSRRIPHSRHLPALRPPVHHENNRRRLFTHRGNPLAMHRSGT